MPHDAFISYSRKDREFAVRLQKALASYTPPKDLPLPHRRVDVFRDEEDFTGAEYYQSIDRHLKDSSTLIVLCSPSARSSQFVNDEIRRFASARGAEHIIALLVAGIPNNEAKPDQQDQMAFPDALCAVMTMPLAADYRDFDPQRSKIDRGRYEASWYTTLANLYGISRAAIEQREKRRRARRRQIVIGATAAALIVLSPLSFVAWRQRQAAIQQESIAAARFLAGRAVAAESESFSRGLRARALIAAESLRKAWTNEGYMAWRRATLQMPPVLGSIKTDSVLIRMAFTPDGTKLVALCGKRHVHVFSVPDLRDLHQVQASDTAFELAIDSTGDQALVYKTNDEFIEAVDLRNGTKRNVFTPAPFRAAAFNAAGDAIVASHTHLWTIDARSDEVDTRITLPTATLSVALSPDGGTMLALTMTSLNAYETRTGAARWQLPLGGTAWRDVGFDGAGHHALVAGEHEQIIVKTATGERIGSLPVKSGADPRAVPLNENSSLVGNELFTTSADAERVLPLVSDDASPLRLPIANPSGRYVAGIDNRGNHENFVVVDLSLKQDSVADDPVAFYVTLEEAHQGIAVAFTAGADILALSSQATGLAPDKPSELQLLSLNRERWQQIVPGRSRTDDLIVLPPDARVVAKHWQSPSTRSFDANGIPIDNDGNGTFASRNGRLVARLERGQGWIVTDTAGKHRVTIPDNGSAIEFSPDEQRVLLFPNIYSLNDSGTPHTVADAKPLLRTWSFPGANLVIGVDQESMSSGDAKKSVLFDWATGKVSAGPGSIHSTYAVSPDGRRFATYEHDVIDIWSVGGTQPDVRSGRVAVNDDTPLHFSPDGSVIAVAACGSVPLYDTTTLELRFRVPIGNACFAGFTRDGKYLVSRTWHAFVPEPTFHPITIDGLLADTCARVLLNLSGREQQRFGVQVPNSCQDRGTSGGVTSVDTR